MNQDLEDSVVTRDGFWKSKSVREAVSKVDGFGNYPVTLDTIEILRKEVIRLNSRNRYIGPKGPGMVLMEQVGFCDGKENYIPFRKSLFIFIDLLLGFNQKMAKKFGRNYLNKVKSKFNSVPIAKAFFALFEANIGSRMFLVEALEQVGRKGLKYESVGGIGSNYKNRDCGIQPLVELTAAIEKHCRALAAKDREKQKIAVSKGNRNSLPKAIVKIFEGGLVVVKYNGIALKLTKLQSEFLFSLLIKKGALPYRELWENLYQAIPYISVDSGPPSRLKTLKKTLLEKLKTTLGTLPNNAEWITTVESYGYSLNQEAVVWSREKDFNAIVQKIITNRKNLL